MSNSVLTNASALIALQNLNSTNNKLAMTQSRVNTGLKVQGAKDNAATWAIAQNQRADTGALEAVKTSMNRATSMADVSLAAGAQISDLLIEMREKVTAAADPSQSPASRKAYNDEFQSLLKSLQSFADNATFDGENILNGKVGGVRPPFILPLPTPPAQPVREPMPPLDFLASAGATETISMNRQDMSSEGLGFDLPARAYAAAVPGVPATPGPPPTPAIPPIPEVTARPAGPPLLDTLENAEEAFKVVVKALDTANARLAELGAQSKQVEKHNLFVGKLMDSLEVGIGNLVDADMAKESARLQALQVQQQLGAQALSIANQAPQIILSLFKG